MNNMAQNEYEELLSFFRILNKLKTTKRTGWVRCDVDNPESVADHIYRTTMISMVMSDMLGLDTNKVLYLSLLHDLAEVITGDITPHEIESDFEKIENETRAFKEIIRKIPNNQYYLSIWDEYVKQGSKEAILVKNIDRFEMALQAFEYKNTQPELDVWEFINDIEGDITIPEIDVLYNIIKTKMQNIK